MGTEQHTGPLQHPTTRETGKKMRCLTLLSQKDLLMEVYAGRELAQGGHPPP